MRARLVSLVVVALAGVGAADPTNPDTAEAEATALANAGDYRAAAAKFAEAFKADPTRAELFCNIGISYYKARDLARAHLLLGRCLERSALDPEFVATARTVLASVEAALRAGGHAPVTVNVEPSATSVAIVELGPDEAFVGTRVVWLPFGTYHFRGHAEGHRDEVVEVMIATPDHKTVALAIQPLAHQANPRPPPRRAARSKLPAIAATGATAVAIAVAAIGYREAHARADLATTAIDQAAFDGDARLVRKWNAAFAIGGALAAVGAGASGLLWYRALSAPARLEVDAVGGGVALSVVGRF